MINLYDKSLGQISWINVPSLNLINLIILFAHFKQLKDICMQPNFEQFWYDRMLTDSKTPQLLVDYDTFIMRFSEEVYRQTSIVLSQLQKQVIKAEIDPEGRNVVYKNGYLLFVKSFWSVPSNRTRLFNMKINLGKIKGSIEGEMAGTIRIEVKYNVEVIEEEEQLKNELTKREHFKREIKEEYLVQNHKITTNSKNSTRQLQYEGFITIGSNPEKCSIVIPVPSVNSEHLKLIYTTSLQILPNSSPSFYIEPKPRTHAFIRDISRSNRARYMIDNENKYFVVKKGMVIGGLGLVQNFYECVIEDVQQVDEGAIRNFIETANADNKSYVFGEPDKPTKMAISFPMQKISQSTVIDLFDRGLYYPQKTVKKSGTQKSSDSSTPLKLRIVNKRTLCQMHCSSKNLKKLSIGRDPLKSDVIIDDIMIRSIELTFECFNDIWFIRKQSHHDVGVYLASEAQKQGLMNSGKIGLGTEYSEKFMIGDVEIRVSVKANAANDDDQY